MHDLEALKDLVNHDYQTFVKRLEAFYKSFEFMWRKENKSFGFEIQDVRLGGLIRRTKHQQRVLLEYIEGKIGKIDELEEQQLDFAGNTQFAHEQICANYWAHIISGNVV